MATLSKETREKIQKIFDQENKKFIGEQKKRLQEIQKLTNKYFNECLATMLVLVCKEKKISPADLCLCHRMNSNIMEGKTYIEYWFDIKPTCEFKKKQNG